MAGAALNVAQKWERGSKNIPTLLYLAKNISDCKIIGTAYEFQRTCLAMV